MIHGVAMKGKQILIPAQLQLKALVHLNSNHTDIEKTRLLMQESLYQFNMNKDTKMPTDATKNQIIPHKTSGKPWQIVGADIFPLL